MANELKMAIVESIFQLRTLRWSARRIARHLGLDRGTVRKYLQRAMSGAKPAIPPAGSSGPKPATYPPAPGGSPPENGRADFSAAVAIPKPAISPTGSPGEIQALPSPEAQAATASAVPPAKRGRPSECEPFQSLILEKLQQELSAQRIYTRHGHFLRFLAATSRAARPAERLPATIVILHNRGATVKHIFRK
jgi:hypothetical protein